jgi:putative sterol carrier protein
MNEIVSEAAKALNEKIEGGFAAGSAKFVITDQGSVIVDADGARAGDDETDVTLTADLETFQGMIEGEINPTAAFMQGKLTVDGDMGMAMQLGAALA